MPSVQNVIDLVQQFQSRGIVVHQDRCVAVRNRNAGCSRCADACSAGCIAQFEDRLVLDPAQCVGCGVCATACPTGALEARDPDDAALFQSCLQAMDACEGEVVIACNKILNAASGKLDLDKVVGATCVGRVDESLLIALAAEGAGHIILVKGPCEDCANEGGLDLAREVRDSTNVVLEAWGSETRVALRSKFPNAVRRVEKGYNEGRRHFFGSAKTNAKKAVGVTADYAVKETQEVLGADPDAEPQPPKVSADGTLPLISSDRRERLAESLAKLGEPKDVMVKTRLWSHVIIDEEKCSSCQACATFCPTGALSRCQDEDGGLSLRFSPSKCVQCRCCEDICLKDAIKLSDEVFAVDIAHGAVERHKMKQSRYLRGGTNRSKESKQELLDSLVYGKKK